MSSRARARATALYVVCLGCSSHVDVGFTQDAGAIGPPRDGGRGGAGLADAAIGFFRDDGPAIGFVGHRSGRIATVSQSSR